jgi:hypothetical protein
MNQATTKIKLEILNHPYLGGRELEGGGIDLHLTLTLSLSPQGRGEEILRFAQNDSR